MAQEQPQQVQQWLSQAQMYQQQLQQVLVQKEQIKLQLAEVKKALEELEKTKEDVYKIAGPILVKTTKEDIKKDLQEKSELFELRVKTLEKGETKLKSQFEELKEKISKLNK